MASLRASLVVGAVAVLGCVPEGPVVMSPARPGDPLAAGPLAAPADSALVVFVRARNACDGGAPFRVVSEDYRFVGDAAPGTKFAALVSPGHHALFAWQPYGDVPPQKYPQANQVGAVEGDFEAAHVYVVEVSIANRPFGVGKSCYRYQWVGLRKVDPDKDPDVARAMGEASAMQPDLAAGQRIVEAGHPEVERHVALGMRKLAR